ncbi:MAG: energy transducer TonB [Thiobacillus sp. 65-1059]|nr:MAG: energy transducer TonB [Thiobacillus sp. 65-1059]
MNASRDEPAIPLRLRRPLAAVWISLGLHAALIALVQLAPPPAGTGAPVIEARLESPRAAPPAADVPPLAPAADAPDDSAQDAPRLAPSETAEALPVAEPAAPAPAASPPAPGAAEPLPGVTIASAVDLTYYSARDLDVPPRALREIVPDYPGAADRQRLSGKVRLQLKLEADGRVSDVDVVSAVPPGLFEDSALKAFRDARFAPAQKGGRPVRALVLIEVEYDWEGRPR